MPGVVAVPTDARFSGSVAPVAKTGMATTVEPAAGPTASVGIAASHPTEPPSGRPYVPDPDGTHAVTAYVTPTKFRGNQRNID